MAAPVSLAFRIAANLTELRANLAGAKAQLETTKSAMKAMANGLDGSKLLGDANAMIKVVTDLGGASMLTERNQRRVNATLTEAIEQYRALGKQAPQTMLDLAAATKRVDDVTKPAVVSGGNLLGTLTKIGGAVGIAFSVNAVKNFVVSVFDAAGKIHDMGLQMGISTDAVQGFKFAAEQGGSSLDAVGTAIGKMNAELAGGDKATVKALKDAGLGFADIRAMKPEDAFLAIADSIMAMDDPMKQVEVGRKLMGKGFDELLPAMKEGFRGVSDSADKMSKETIDSLEKAGDAWQKLWNKVVIVSGGIIAEMMKNRPFTAEYANNQMKFGTQYANDIADIAARAAEHAGKIYAPFKQPPPPGMKQTQEQLDAIAAAAKKSADAFKAMFDKFSGTGATADMKMLDAVFRQLAASGKLTADQVDAIVKEALKLQGEGATLTERLYDMAKVTDKLNPHLTVTALELGKIGTQIDIVAPKLDAYLAALKTVAALPKGSVGNINFGNVNEIEIGKPNIEGATKAIRANADWAQSLSSLTQAFDQLAGSSSNSLSRVVGSIANVTAALQQSMSIMTKGGPKGGASHAGTGGILTPFFDADATSSEKWAAGISGGVTAASGAMSVWADVSSKGTKSSAALAGAMGGAKAGAAFGPWGMAIGAVAGAVTGMIRAMSAGRREVENFAKSFDTAAAGTGFDELQKKMLTLGDDYDRMWRKLTQQTKKGDKAGAQAVIAEIQGMLANTPEALAAAAGFQTSAQLQAVAEKAREVYEYMVSSGKYSASEIAKAFAASGEAQKAIFGESSKAQQEALDAINDKYSGAISKLESEYKSLSDSVSKEAEEEFMGIIETQERARMEQIAAEKKAQEMMRDAEIAAKTETFDATLEAGQKTFDELRRIFGQGLDIPTRYGVPGFASGGGSSGGTYVPSSAPTYRESGGTTSAFPGGSASRASSSGNGDTTVTVVMPDGDVLLRQVVKSGKRRGWM